MLQRIHIFETERINNPLHMIVLQTKDQYISPECEVLDVRLEGVIAASLGPYSGFGDEETM